jgi:hypothetical protein
MSATQGASRNSLQATSGRANARAKAVKAWPSVFILLRKRLEEAGNLGGRTSCLQVGRSRASLSALAAQTASDRRKAKCRQELTPQKWGCLPGSGDPSLKLGQIRPRRPRPRLRKTPQGRDKIGVCPSAPKAGRSPLFPGAGVPSSLEVAAWEARNSPWSRFFFRGLSASRPGKRLGSTRKGPKTPCAGSASKSGVLVIGVTDGGGWVS